LKKQTRSRILAMSITGALVAGGCLPLIPLAVARAQQSQPAAGALLDRAQRLLTQQQYQTAKQVLLSIDPSQLSSADQDRLTDLLKQADQSLAAQSQDNQIFDNAQASLRDGHLAHAVSLYNIIINDPNASTELKREAQDNLVLAQAKQQELAPQMENLLQQAIAAYNVGKFDEADQDLYQIRMTGSDLGSDNGTPAQYQYLIAQKRVQLAQAALAAQEQQAAQQSAAQQSQQKAQVQAAQQAAAQNAQQAQLAEQQQAQEQALAQKLAQQKAAQEAAQQQQAQQQAQAAQEAAQQQQAQQQTQAAQEAAQQAAQEAAQQQQAQQQAQAAQEAAQEAAQQQAQEQQAQTAQEAAPQQRAQQQTQAAQPSAQNATEQTTQLNSQQEQAAEQSALQQQAIQQKLLAQQQAEDQQLEQTRQAQAAQEAQEQAANENSNETPVPEESQPAPSIPVVTTPSPGPISAEVAPNSVTTSAGLPTREQINQQRAAALVVQADQAVRAAQYQNAIALYNSALALDPQNEEAQSGLAYAEKLAGGQTPNILTQTLTTSALAAQRNQVLFDNDMLLSTQSLQKDDFTTAQNKALDALATAVASQQYFTQDQYETMLNRAQQQKDLVQQQQAQYLAQEKAKQQQEALTSEQQIEQQVAEQREQEINQLMGQATEYYKRMQYQQALDTLNQVVAIDPNNNTALFMQQMVQDQVEYQQWNSYHVQRSSEMQKQIVEVESEMIPYDRLEVYPDDWPEISRLRESEQSTTQSPADQAVYRALAESVPNISVNQQPFEDVINLLRQETGANIVVNWNALANAGVQKQTPVTLTLQNVPFSKVLDLTLQQVQSSGGAQLGYSVDEGVLTISTTDQLAQQSVIQVFDIQDLLVQAPNFTNAPQFNLAAASQNQTASISSSGGGGGGSGAGGGNIFGGGGGGATTTTSTTDQLTQITQLIENEVDRNSWVDNGGTVGTIRSLNGQLIVNQTPEAMTKITNLLEQLREARALEISIETRFLVVDSSFLNDFGFSWSLDFNNFGSGLSISNNTATLAAPQGTGEGLNIGGGFVPSNSSLSISGGILSSYQLSMLMNATQEDQNVTKLDAPRIILFNGQRSWIAVTTQEAYVSSFTQSASGGTGIGGLGAVATNLNVSTLSVGVVLDVQATASADRRYVEMTITPSMATLLSLAQFNVQGINTAGATNTALSPGFVQLPEIELTTLSTTVSVPDDGTLLLGGQRVAGETEIEAGVPILSKIPIINRLFTNRSFVRDSGILLILVHPQIIIQKEYEKAQFGTNYDSPNDQNE
jgi:type II secretory pathway component GspD/PulD (secretin)/tetratricopeptide (TPR) repeat protein